MRYLDVCAGVSAATVAWKPLGWEAAAYSEIAKAPRKVLAYRYPDTPLHGDFTTIQEGDYGSIELLMGGTPCQDFSVAGLRSGISGERGNLTLEYLRLADRLRPRWLSWENVPGVFSADERRAFGAFLGGMGQLGYGFAYRVLDAQYFGVPQRRRRVIVVGYLGDWRRAAAVLFERATLESGGGAWLEKGAENLATVSTRFAEGSIDLFDQINIMAQVGGGASSPHLPRDGARVRFRGPLHGRAGRHGKASLQDARQQHPGSVAGLHRKAHRLG